MPLVSAELRWFAEGAPPPEVERWFAALGPPDRLAAEPPRVDRYVAPASPDEPGVKLRDLKPDAGPDAPPPKLEVKQRARALGSSAYGPVRGVAEAWRKWSLPLATPDADTDGWVDVRKQRRMWTLAVTDGAAEVVAPSDRLQVGANVELSVLEVEGRPWWSVCVEAFAPDEAAAGRALGVAAAHVFGPDAPPALTAGRSAGYPAWLHRVAGG